MIHIINVGFMEHWKEGDVCTDLGSIRTKLPLFPQVMPLFYSIFFGLNAINQGTVSGSEAKCCLTPVDLSFLPFLQKRITQFKLIRNEPRPLLDTGRFPLPLQEHYLLLNLPPQAMNWQLGRADPLGSD